MLFFRLSVVVAASVVVAVIIACHFPFLALLPTPPSPPPLTVTLFFSLLSLPALAVTPTLL